MIILVGAGVGAGVGDGVLKGEGVWDEMAALCGDGMDESERAWLELELVTDAALSL